MDNKQESQDECNHPERPMTPGEAEIARKLDEFFDDDESHEGVEELTEQEQMYEWAVPYVDKLRAKYPRVFNMEGLEPALTSDIADIIIEFKRSKLTPLVAQKEQKEGVEECWKANPYEDGKCANGACRNCRAYPISETPTPTVKEESHTQGWEEKLGQMLHGWTATKATEEKYGIIKEGEAIVGIDKLKAFIKEIVEVAEKQAMLRQRHYDEKLARDREVSAFDAGYAQCKVDAVAVVPQQRSDMFSYGEGAAAGGAQDGWNACRQAVLTALEAIKNKK